jgi:hypothetical protein
MLDLKRVASLADHHKSSVMPIGGPEKSVKILVEDRSTGPWTSLQKLL